MRTSRSSVTGGSKSGRLSNSTVDTVDASSVVGTAEPVVVEVAVDVDVVAAVEDTVDVDVVARPSVLLVVSTAAGDTVGAVVDALSWSPLHDATTSSVADKAAARRNERRAAPNGTVRDILQSA